MKTPHATTREIMLIKVELDADGSVYGNQNGCLHCTTRPLPCAQQLISIRGSWEGERLVLLFAAQKWRSRAKGIERYVDMVERIAASA